MSGDEKMDRGVAERELKALSRICAKLLRSALGMLALERGDAVVDFLVDALMDDLQLAQYLQLVVCCLSTYLPPVHNKACCWKR